MTKQPIIGSNESVNYGKIVKKEDDNWYIMFRCQHCNDVVNELIIDYNSFDWNTYKAGIDQKRRFFHRCDKDGWFYSTIIIKGKRVNAYSEWRLYGC